SLDDWPPLLDLGLLKCTKRVGGLMFGRIDLVANGVEPLAYRRICDGPDDSMVELGDNFLGRARRGPKRIPKQRVKARQASLVNGRNFGRGRQAMIGRNGISLDLADADVRKRIGRARDNQIDLSGHEVLHGRTASAIRHELKLRAGHFLKKDPKDMSWTAHAGSSGRCLSGVGFQPGNKTLQVISGRSLPRNDYGGIARKQGDGLKIFQ